MNTLLQEILNGNILSGAIVEVDPPKRQLSAFEWDMLYQFLKKMKITLIVRQPGGG
jgi:hypothetical protein